MESKAVDIFDCEKCRADNMENETIPPCDLGKECPVGFIELLSENIEAVLLFNEIELLGWELVKDFKNIHKTPQELEMLFQKLKTIKTVIRDMQFEAD